LPPSNPWTVHSIVYPPYFLRVRVIGAPDIKLEFDPDVQRYQLERFRAKWLPVRVKKTRQIKNLEPRFDSIETEKALVAECRAQAGNPAQTRPK
jgi:hypothetical protein